MSEFRRGRGRGGAVSRPRPVAPTGAAASARDIEDDTEEADEIKDLREKYGGKLSTAKELFPEWTDEDLLFTIGEAHGDLDLAIVRITDGQAEQFHVKAKKEKKVTPVVAQPTFSPGPGRGGFGDRGGRGRGALVAGRGGRGVPRGARGGIVSAATPRAPYANGASNGTTPASFTAPAPTAAAPTWVTPAAAAASSTTAAPTGWGDVAAASSVAAQASSDWGAPTETSTTATQGWGDEPAKTNGDAAHDAPEPAAVGAGDGWAAPKAKPASKIIAPGAKMSWAQIARPVSPPKPAPLPPAPIAAPAPPPVAAPAPSPPAPEPVVEAAAPEPIVEPEPVQTSASWNEAPAAPGPLDAWGSAPPAASTPAPLGVGEGWADSVSAAPEPKQPYANQIQPEVDAHLPPNDIQTAGPIDVSTPAVEESIQTIPVAPEPPVGTGQDKIFGAGPPGLSKRTSNRPQQEAVVMPSERAQTGLDIGVQFGSLNLFENQPSFGQQEAPVAQLKSEPSFIQQEAAPAPAPQQYSHEAAQHQNLLAQHAQVAQQHHQSQEQGVQTSFSQPPPNSFAQNNAFANRYPSSSYGAPPPHAEEPQHTPYAPFKQQEASPYFQHPGSAHSPAPQGQGVPAASYAPFNSLQQQAPGQAPGFTASQQSDYAGAYGQEALRNMGFYDQYGQAQGAGFQQTATPLPRSDDPAAAGSPAPVTPQPGQTAPHQQFPGQGQQQYMPPQYGYGHQYGYPQPYYNQAQYAPNFNALQQQYSQYGQQQYGQPQGYGRAPAQYAPQPSQQGSFRQGQPGVPQNQAPNPAAQAYNYGGYPAAAANAYDPRAIPGGQGQERKADQYSSSKDLDRGFY